jgi:hypothetical protein
MLAKDRSGVIEMLRDVAAMDQEGKKMVYFAWRCSISPLKGENSRANELNLASPGDIIVEIYAAA